MPVIDWEPMETVFYLSSAIALVSTAMVISRIHAMHAALYLIVSLLAAAVVMFSVGAPFTGALEIIVYAGAIMVLMVFVIMLLNVNREKKNPERKWLRPTAWLGPGMLSFLLLGLLGLLLTEKHSGNVGQGEVEVKQVAASIFGIYLIGVELASMLLMAGVVGAFHLGLKKREPISTE